MVVSERKSKEMEVTTEVQDLVARAVKGLREGDYLDSDGVFTQPRARHSALLLAVTRLNRAAALIETTWPGRGSKGK